MATPAGAAVAPEGMDVNRIGSGLDWRAAFEAVCGFPLGEAFRRSEAIGVVRAALPHASWRAAEQKWDIIRAEMVATGQMECVGHGAFRWRPADPLVCAAGPT